MRKFLSVLLAFAMMLSLGVTTLAAEDTAVGTTAVEQTYAGKTVILHSNDVHGAITGYACIAALKTDYESRGAEVILVDAGDYSQGTTNVSITKGADAVAMMNAAGYDVVTIGSWTICPRRSSRSSALMCLMLTARPSSMRTTPTPPSPA